MNNLKKYAPMILRTSIAIILLWFAFSQIKNPSSWTRLIPEYSSAFMTAKDIIYLNAFIEIILALLLLLGLFTRISSLITTIHLFHITTIVGYGPTGARDFALALACLAIFFYGKDDFCLDNYLFKKSQTLSNSFNLLK